MPKSSVPGPRYRRAFSFRTILVIILASSAIGFSLGIYLSRSGQVPVASASVTSSTSNPNTTTPPTTEPATSTTTSTETPGVLPQTAQLPSSTSAEFTARMQDLFQGVAILDLPNAVKSFFPLPAYLQVKALTDNSFDYADRLLLHFTLDLEAAHALLMSQGTSFSFVGMKVDAAHAAWIPPGACSNKLGYWHLPGSRLLYRANGILYSIGVLSLISWRGEWYVVHMGAISRASNIGYVDSPATGAGTLGPAGGC